MRINTYLWKKGENINQIDLKVSTNKKLGLGSIILSTYHFSKKQIEDIDLSKDTYNCMNCVYSYNQNKGKSGGCYTHKSFSRMGLLSKIRSINKIGDLNNFSIKKFNNFIKDSSKFSVDLCRFGVYGEPVLLSEYVVNSLRSISKNSTGYSHQWDRPKYKNYSKYFMASTHTTEQTLKAKEMGWRSFQVDGNMGVQCPASKEANRVSTCVKCSLCSGSLGKGDKSIYIKKH